MREHRCDRARAVGSDVVSAPQITLTARLTTSAVDARRGVVRLHPEVLDALGLRPWDAVRLTGARSSAALAAAGHTAPGIVLLDDLTLSNLGLTDGSEVVLAPVQVRAAHSITVAASTLVSHVLSPDTLRLALAGKVVTAGDAVSLLPQDVAPGSDATTARSQLATAIGMSWTSELLTVTATDPAGPVAPHPSTVIGWGPGHRPAEQPGQPGQPPSIPSPELPAPAVTDLVGAQGAARRLAEWFELTFRRPELLRRLGAGTRLGVAVHGPEGVGKATMVRAVARDAGAHLVELSAPSAAARQPGDAAQQLHDAVAAARQRQPSVLLITDVEALLPATDPPPLATVVLDALVPALDSTALVVTTAHPESVDPRLRAPQLVDRELSIPLPDARTRTGLLRVLLSAVPLAADVDLATVGERTPGFVAADLVALRREAAVQAALRHTSQPGTDLTITQQDLIGALDTVRPVSMSTSNTINTGGLTIDEVGDMTETKQALTEAVLWPLRYPDSFTRLGVDPPRGVLLYGPPGCGKTFLVRALAGSGALNVFSVKGAELLDKWVGESERAVRELFRRATDAAPALVFLDEVDALAPRRGGSSDAGVADRVVAALLTELDGVEPMRDVVVLGATNRPELIDPALLRPGRLERLVYVPPPDAQARAAILKAAARNTPLAADVDLDALATELDGYSAADCTALIREAALTAMRQSLDATEVTVAQLAAARRAVRPSLDPTQLADLARYADARR
jgi:transitional endoplasmic reticulum ATPase